MVNTKAPKSNKTKSTPKAITKSENGLHAEKTDGKAGNVRAVSPKNHRTNRGFKQVAQVLRKTHRQKKRSQAEYKSSGNKANVHLQDANMMTSSPTSKASRYHKFRFNGTYDKDIQQSERRTREHGTKELVLPSDSNVVKGNV